MVNNLPGHIISDLTGHLIFRCHLRVGGGPANQIHTHHLEQYSHTHSKCKWARFTSLCHACPWDRCYLFNFQHQNDTCADFIKFCWFMGPTNCKAWRASPLQDRYDPLAASIQMILMLTPGPKSYSQGGGVSTCVPDRHMTTILVADWKQVGRGKLAKILLEKKNNKRR